MEKAFIDSNELNEFILEESKKRGFNISEEIIDLVLDLEMEFLDLKGLIEEV
ncbi:hypothetical protein ACQR2L_19230 (plasmid) [Clostridium butyricum]|uniref:hypothetical protein n=1 Tax=Clostridium butyricum TaxID=1492 RepID=UPI003D096A41